jgi:drug/metabolite transporter (DMT)-like permease
VNAARQPWELALAILAGLTAVTIWGAVPALVKAGLAAGTAPSVFLVVRYGVVGALLAFVLPALVRKVRLLSPGLLAGYATLVALHTIAQTVALQTRTVTSSWYCLAFATSPLLTLVLLRTGWTIRLAASALCAVAGVLFFVEPGALAAPGSVLGSAALAVSTISWAAAIAVLPRLLNGQQGAQASLSRLELLALSVWPVALASAVLWVADGLPAYRPSPSGLAALAALVLLTPLAFALYLQAMHLLPSFAVAVQYLELGVGALVGALALDEPFALPQAAGLTLVVVALLVMPAQTAPDREVDGAAEPNLPGSR